MLLIIIGAIVNLLIFFFEQWWRQHHPSRPTAIVRRQFIDQIGSLRYFWMGPSREKYAAALFDKFVANYDANPPKFTASDAPLSDNQASELAHKYTQGLTL